MLDDVAKIVSMKTTHDDSTISYAVFCLNKINRLQTLAFGVQNNEQHHMFKRWVTSLGDAWRQQHPEAKHICEQLGISISDMTAAFGKRWTGNEGTPFNLFRTRKLGCVNFVSVDLINEFSDCGSGSFSAPQCNAKDPKCNTVANKKIHSTALGRLEKQISISSNLMRSSFIEKAKDLTKPSPTSKKKPAPATAKKAPKSITTSPAQEIPPIASQDAPLLLQFHLKMPPPLIRFHGFHEM